MPDVNKVNFYAGKPTSLPRFVYRRLAQALRKDGVDRAAAIAAALEELLNGADPDLRKFKFVVPEFVRRLLTAEELADLTAGLEARRVRAAQLRMVFPHASDEFGLDPRFLDSVLHLDDGPPLPRTGRFFTIGSCFARNIATFLAANGVQARTFGMAEDLNSPISNAFMFDMLQRPAAARAEALTDWVGRLFPELGADEVRDAAARKGAELDGLVAELRAADCVVLTLGNVVDFFREGVSASAPLVDKAFPKFVAMPASEDIRLRANAAARLKKLGATLRLATYDETRQAIEGCIAGIRSVTASPIVVTLSPVPVDSVIGLSNANLKSAVEVDCVSKARLRSAFDEVAETMSGLHYFPSFEIVRWIGPMLPIANFGFDDAASRHVSSPILDAICATFLNRFVRWSEPATGAPAEPNLSPALDA